MSQDNVKSHKKQEFHPLFRRYIFRKTTRGVKLTPSPPAILGLRFPNHFKSNLWSTAEKSREKQGKAEVLVIFELRFYFESVKKIASKRYVLL